MLRTTCFVAATAFVASSAQAALTGVNSLSLYQSLVGIQAFQDQTINLNAYSVGVVTSPLQGVTGGTAWSASALSGLYLGDLASGTRYLSTFASNRELTISFEGAGVMAFGANTFLTNQGDEVISGNVLMKLSDGTTFAASVGSESSFYGWVSEGDVTITSVTYRPFLSGSGSFASLSDLRFALIPSSGAMAILALGGLVAVRSRP
ncbi:MAG: hypothetical protein FJ252_06740 [Phycisphaerae bacterium]|nr:hypothetical protein [Phycisphaerae bacterium]